MLRAAIIGNIGGDPELRYSAGGAAFLFAAAVFLACFSLACWFFALLLALGDLSPIGDNLPLRGARDCAAGEPTTASRPW